MPWRRRSRPARIRSILMHVPIAAARATRWCVMLGCAALLPASAGAQLQAGLELAGAQVAQPNFPSHRAGTAQLGLGFDAAAFSLHGGSLWTRPQWQRVRVHHVIRGAVRTDRARRLGLEATAAGSAYDDGAWPEAVSLHAGLGARARFTGLTLEAGIGTGALDDGFHEYPMTTVEIGGATTWRQVPVRAAVTLHRTLGEPRVEIVDGSTPIAVTTRDPITYTDMAVRALLVRRGVELEVRGGTRIVHRTIAFEPRPGPRLFGTVDAAWWIRAHAAIALVLGNELADLSRGLPAARFASLGVRLQWRAPTSRLVARTHPSRTTGDAIAPEVLLERGDAPGATLRVHIAGRARQVEVAGTFTGWEPVSLTAGADGTWSLAMRVGPGPHRLLVRVDGGPWQPPANLPALDDGFGGRVGIVTIP